jgi:putative Mn2+ efflux pump MntP
MSFDNLAYGAAAPSPGAGVVAHALVLGASSAALAWVGLVAGAALGRRCPGSAERWAAAGLVAASFVLLRA